MLLFTLSTCHSYHLSVISAKRLKINYSFKNKIKFI